ncbi:MAG: Asp-tRNA(Asn)/Glu-tRNA(Gln) amidotransferase subunit GatB [Chitinophagales bacterium]|nr:Asp-tRNA(Asn)/Glu-tRNA(Gln) amidotransferase subunit GatB [Chitinophagales bacterium]
MNKESYEAVIGLEVHAQLLTKTKAYSSDIAEYGGDPNTHVSVVTLGHPGTLPVFNKRTAELAITMGLATHCKIREHNLFARKNYFYADLPKGYQITQDQTPICTEGYVEIGESRKEKRIGITRIHMEEDAGKSIHELDPYFTLIDLNRAGTPLIEIVSEPDLRSGEEAYEYLTEIRKLVRYLAICDGNMEEGSLRCDANISVRKKGASEFGVKVEVKNMNSIRNVKRAIDHEIERQIAAIENGETISQETRSFDAAAGTTFSMRSKEAAHDYRYFPEPDLPPLRIHAAMVEEIRSGMPALPKELQKRYEQELGLSTYDAALLTAEKSVVTYFEALIQHTTRYKAAANWILGPVREWLNAGARDMDDFPVAPAQLAALLALIDEGKLSFSAAAQQLLPVWVEEPDTAPDALAQKLNLIQETDEAFIEQLVDEALKAFPDKVAEYRNGKKGLIGLFMGEVMKRSKGKADPKVATALLQKKLEA